MPRTVPPGKPSRRGVLVLGLLLVTAGLASAQEAVSPADTTVSADTPAVMATDTSAVTPRAVPQATLERLRADPDFKYDDDPEPPVTFFQIVFLWIWEHLVEPFLTHTSPGFRQGLTWVLFIVVLVVALLKLLGAEFGGLFGRSSRRAGPGAAEQADEELAAVDWNARLADALAQGDYRAAVRYRFLRALLGLVVRGRLAWQPDKTNRTYGRDLEASDARQGPAFAPAFRAAANVYDAVWYGHKPLDATRYAALTQPFDDLEALLATVPALPKAETPRLHLSDEPLPAARQAPAGAGL